MAVIFFKGKNKNDVEVSSTKDIMSVNATDKGHLLTLLPEDLSPRCAVEIVCSKRTYTIRVVVQDIILCMLSVTTDKLNG